MLVPLDQPDTARRIREHSPAEKVPILVDDEVTVWDSLAICEYLAEKHPSARLWPADRAARAVARSISAEMHSGFVALRSAMPMNIRLERKLDALPADVGADVSRVRAIWRECRARASGGEFLFGSFGIADAFFAPVAMRFRSYGVALDGPEAAYVEAIRRHPAVETWVTAARAEPFSIPKYDR